jgi:peptidoglycan/LPS O-acetylase OafA/YrhL
VGTIRLLLALSVVIAHAEPLFGLTLVGGKLAVQSFFVISGFYMSLILSEKYPSGVAGTWLFYGNRFLRIYPLYWITLLLSVAAFACVWAISSVAPNFAHSFAKLDIIRQAVPKFSLDQIIFWLISNVSLLGIDLAYFMRFDGDHLALTSNWASHHPWPPDLYFVPQAWTLGIEVTIYLIAPWLFRRSIGLLIFILLVSFSSRAATFGSGLTWDPWVNRFFPSESGLFVLGAILYRCYRYVDFGRTTCIASLLVCVVAVFSFQFLPEMGQPILGFEAKELLYLSAFCVGLPGAFKATREWKADRWIGELSYPVYLVHVLVVAACRSHFGLSGELPVLGSILFAAILTSAIEAPLYRLRQARVKAVTVSPEAPHDVQQHGKLQSVHAA